MNQTLRKKRSARDKGFGKPSSGKTRIDWKVRLLLGLTPALIFLGHLAYGANQYLASQWFAFILALALGGALLIPQARLALFDLKPAAVPAVLFLAVLGIAALTLTPFTPGGAHPIWAWAGFDGASTINRSATILEMTKLAGLACVFVLGCLHSARIDRARATVDAVLIIGAAYTTITLLLFLAGAQVMAGGRLSGGFLSANSGASVYGVLTVVALGDLLGRWRKAQGLDALSRLSRLSVPLAFTMLFATCVVLTASRMGAAATAVAAGVLLMWDMLETKGGRLPVLIGGGLLLVVGVVLVAGGNDLLWTRADELDRDIAVRGDIFAAHWKAFLGSPLFGYGLGSFTDLNTQIMTAENYGALWKIRATHNVYLQWLEEAGIVGAVPMFLLIGCLIGVSIWRSAGTQGGRAVLRGLIAANLVILIHGTTDFALQTPSIAAFWAFLLGIQFAFDQARDGG